MMINAAQGTEGQDWPAEITVSATATPEGFTFAVEDSGGGIPLDRFGQLFDTFYTTKATGIGIGSPVSKTIADAHGGTISAGSGLDGGAKFVFIIPSPND